jgi:hypothetical protein
VTLQRTEDGSKVRHLCPIPWRPHALTPVSFGWGDYGPTDGLPVRTRVFFPSVDGAFSAVADESPADAAILDGCGRYPLVLLVHDPSEKGAAQRWTGLPSQLARCGYVVALPDIHALPSPPAAHTDPTAESLHDVVAWIRTAWPHRRLLTPPDLTGVVGHRGGALVAARFAARTAGAPTTRTARARRAIARALRRSHTSATPIRIRAFASLGGPWRARPGADRLLTGMPAAKLFVRGPDHDTVVDELWPALSAPKYETLIDGMAQSDYLGDDEDRLALQTLGYDEIFAVKPPYSTVVADVVTMFLAAHLPQPSTRTTSRRISHHLVPPPLRLTREQWLFAKGHLAGITRLTRSGGRIHLRHDTGASSGLLTLP